MNLKKFSNHLNYCQLHTHLLKHVERRWCHGRATEDINIRRIPERMSAWQVTSFADGGKVELSDNVPVPIINDPHHVLVKVACASVNPLDVEMIRGFGHVLFKNMSSLKSLLGKNSNTQQELPITLGRDFSGVVVAKGSSVDKFNIGDQVYGVIKPGEPGCHSEYTLAKDSLVVKKPDFLSMEKASAILYTTMTAHAGLKRFGYLGGSEIPKGFPVLVIGASGGVGQAAVQLLKAWNCYVVATCKTDAIPVVEKLNPHVVVDYTKPRYLINLSVSTDGSYYIILDAAGLPEKELYEFNNILADSGTIVTLKSPVLENIDRHGLILGALKSVNDLILSNVAVGSSPINIKLRWGYFLPSTIAVKEISDLVEKQMVDPQVEQVYAFSDAEKAYTRMKEGHLRGKIVISLKSTSK